MINPSVASPRVHAANTSVDIDLFAACAGRDPREL